MLSSTWSISVKSCWASVHYEEHLGELVGTRVANECVLGYILLKKEFERTPVTDQNSRTTISALIVQATKLYKAWGRQELSCKSLVSDNPL